jgi:acetoin:2,6-dichlorophenolindophenol oxidoreductase subunit beta
MTVKTYAEAVIDALMGELRDNPNLHIIGRGILGHGGQEHFAKPLNEQFDDRITDPPTAEGATASMGIGAAMSGLTMFAHFGTASFALEAWNQIIHEAGTAHAMSGGQIKVPIVFHMYHGLRGGGSAQHSISPQAMVANNPGLYVMQPTSPRDVKGMLRTALKGSNPVVWIDHAKLLGQTGEVPDEDYEIPFGQAEVKREGKDVTIVATSRAVLWALEAAETLAADSISAEVVDPRSIVPLDADTIVASITKTGRLVTVDEGIQMCSVGSEIAALAAERAQGALKAPVARVARAATPVPFSPPLEEAVAPSPARIIEAVKRIIA